MKAVLYTQRVEIITTYKERRDCADQRIADWLYKNEYLPFPVPNKKEYVQDIVRHLNPVGIVLTGGNSLVKYGGNAPERDATDRMLIELAVQKKIPLYGICRGMQSILDYFGAQLIEVQNHVAVQHLISGMICESVNSYHKQACTCLDDCSELEVLARAEDGVIEAVRHKELEIIATMWHPEREVPFANHDRKRLKTLFR